MRFVVDFSMRQLQFTSRKECRTGHGTWGPQKVCFRAYVTHRHGPMGFCSERQKRFPSLPKSRGPWQRNAVFILLSRFFNACVHQTLLQSCKQKGEKVIYDMGQLHGTRCKQPLILELEGPWHVIYELCDWPRSQRRSKFAFYTRPWGLEGPKKYKWATKSTWHPTYMSDTTIHGLPDIVLGPSKTCAFNVKPGDVASN